VHSSRSETKAHECLFRPWSVFDRMHKSARGFWYPSDSSRTERQRTRGVQAHLAGDRPQILSVTPTPTPTIYATTTATAPGRTAGRSAAWAGSSTDPARAGTSLRHRARPYGWDWCCLYRAALGSGLGWTALNLQAGQQHGPAGQSRPVLALGVARAAGWGRWFRVLACRCRPMVRAVRVSPRIWAAACGSPRASSVVGTVGSIHPSRNLGMSTRATRRRLGSPERFHHGPGASRRVPYGGACPGHCLRAWITGGSVTAGAAGLIRPSRNLGMSTRATRRRLGSPGRWHRGPSAGRCVPYGGAHPGYCRRVWIAGGSDTGGPSGIHCQSRSPVSRASARTSLVGQRGRSGQYRGPPSS
jgi:hypothetical protein